MLSQSYSYIVSVILLITSFFRSSYSQYKEKPYEILNIIKSVPTTEKPDFILGRPVDIDITPTGDIFIMDIQSSQIYKLDEQGDLLKIIGRNGGGPGEFFNPIALCCRDSIVATYEMGVKRMQFFDYDGNYLSSFKTMVDPYPIALINDGIAGVVVKRSKNYNKFINIFNLNGKKINEFGNILKYENFLINRALMKMYNGHLYIAFRFQPELRVYSFQGELLMKKDFKEMGYAGLVQENYEPNNYKIINNKFYLDVFFKGLVINKTGIFLCYPRDMKTKIGVVIDRFSLEGNFVKRYICQGIKEIVDFELLESLEGLKFYLLGYSLDDVPVMSICHEK